MTPLVLLDIATLLGVAAALSREVLLLRASRREIDRYLEWWWLLS